LEVNMKSAIRMTALVSAAVAVALAPAVPASASLNPPHDTNFNCYLATSSDNGPAYESTVTTVGRLYYGDDDEKHGDNGICEWLAHYGVKAVQSRWEIQATFSVPVSRFKESSLSSASGSLKMNIRSTAFNQSEVGNTSAGYVSVDLSKGAGVEIGGSYERQFKVKLLRNVERRIPMKLSSSQFQNCAVKERGERRVYVSCQWVLGVGAFTWIEPNGRTDGGLQVMGLSGSIKFPGAKPVSISALFTDAP